MLNFFRSQSGSIKNDVLSGLTVALALVPEAIAFAFVAGVNPVIGLYSAFFIGLISAICGGRPGMISGATGAMAVVVVALVAQHGVEYLFPTVILCGLIQVVVGICRLGKFIRMVPQPVMLGFVNGLAIVILLAQFDSFKTLSPEGALVYLGGTRMFLMLALIGLTMAIIWLLPKFSRAVPASLAAILSVTLIALSINYYSAEPGGTRALATVGDMLHTKSVAAANGHGHGGAAHGKEGNGNSATTGTTESESNPMVATAIAGNATQQTVDSEKTIVEPTEGETAQATDQATASSGMSGELPVLFFFQYSMIPFTLDSLWIILPYALTLCGVGLIESLMTLTLIDEITETRGSGNRECVGQGTANIVCGLFGGMGGCAMIGQSLINVNSGGRGRLSGITAAVCLLLFVLFLAPLIEQIPMAALTGVMFMVVIGTFEWTSLKMFRRMPKSDMFVMVLVAAYTVLMHDLASAVILGVVVSALVFSWQHATHIGADSKYDEHGSKIYQVHGPLFFASAFSFKEIFDIDGDPDDVVIDFYYSRVYDQSGLEAINTLSEKYKSVGKRLHVTHLNPKCRELFVDAGDLIEVNMSDSPQFHVESDRLA
jgi:SulP family sulfate permease